LAVIIITKVGDKTHLLDRVNLYHVPNFLTNAEQEETFEVIA